MKTKMVAELKGVLLTHALHQLIPQIETNKHYRVRIEEIDSDKLTMQGNDLGVLVGGQVAVSVDELTYAEVWENQQRFDNKRERAYLEPEFRHDLGGAEADEERAGIIALNGNEGDHYREAMNWKQIGEEIIQGMRARGVL